MGNATLTDLLFPFVAIVLFVLSLSVFSAPTQEVPYRLCMIGAFASMAAHAKSGPWLFMDIGFIIWNFARLMMILRG